MSVDAKAFPAVFEDISTHAGIVRDYGISKGDTVFADPKHLPHLFNKELPIRIDALNKTANNPSKYIGATVDLHSTLDLAHPFREGNGRSTRTFMEQLAEKQGYSLDFSKVDKAEWVAASKESIQTGNDEKKRVVFEKVVTLTRERVIDSALHSLSESSSPENKERILDQLKNHGIKSDEISNRAKVLKEGMIKHSTIYKSTDNDGVER